MAIKIRYRPAVVSYVAGERCVSPECQVVDGGNAWVAANYKTEG